MNLIFVPFDRDKFPIERYINEFVFYQNNTIFTKSQHLLCAGVKRGRKILKELGKTTFEKIYLRGTESLKNVQKNGIKSYINFWPCTLNKCPFVVLNNTVQSL